MTYVFLAQHHWGYFGGFYTHLYLCRLYFVSSNSGYYAVVCILAIVLASGFQAV